jgi:hypothetical protein
MVVTMSLVNRVWLGDIVLGDPGLIVILSLMGSGLELAPHEIGPDDCDNVLVHQEPFPHTNHHHTTVRVLHSNIPVGVWATMDAKIFCSIIEETGESCLPSISSATKDYRVGL